MIGKGKLIWYSWSEKHKPGKDLGDAITGILTTYNVREIYIRSDEAVGLREFDVPVRTTTGIQTHHFLVVLATRKPVIFGGERCPIIR